MQDNQSAPLGIYIDNLSLPWTRQIFELAEQTNIVLFTNNFGEFDVYNKIGVLASHHLWSFSGTVIAGDTFSACYLSNCPIPKRRLFYINHVDWTSPAFDAIDITKAASLELLCKPELEPIIKGVWGKVTSCKDWSYEEIQRILE